MAGDPLIELERLAKGANNPLLLLLPVNRSYVARVAAAATNAIKEDRKRIAELEAAIEEIKRSMKG